MFWIKATDKNIWRQTNSTAHEASGRMDSKEKRGKRKERNLGADLPPEATCPECGKYSELDCFFGHSLLRPTPDLLNDVYSSMLLMNQRR